MCPQAATAADAAFSAMLLAAQPKALALLRRLCGGDAEDVLQETLGKVWRLRGSWNPAIVGDGWLLQAAFRTFCDWRQRRAAHPATEPLAEPVAPQPPCPLELRDEVEHCLRALRPIERALLLGFHRDGLSIDELAAAHALSPNTVKSHLHRARKRLQQESHER